MVFWSHEDGSTLVPHLEGMLEMRWNQKCSFRVKSC
jgi:hypothetical protein